MLVDSAFFLLIQLFVFFNTNSISNPKSIKIVRSVESQSMPKVDSLSKYVYLTFDNGPLPGSSNCIDICLNEGVKASFFEIGVHYTRSAFGKKIYDKIQNHPSQFVLCNHSLTHAFMGKYQAYYHLPDSALSDFLKGSKVLKVKNNIARLPGNNGWATAQGIKGSGLVKPLLHKLDSVGINVIGWDMEWHFNKMGRPISSPEHIIKLADSLLTHNLLRNKNHLVILMHDHMFKNPEDSLKLVTLIKGLKEIPHVQFEKINAYPQLKQ